MDWLADGQFPLDGLIHRTAPDNPDTLYGKIMSRTIAEPFIVLDWTGVGA